MVWDKLPVRAPSDRGIWALLGEDLAEPASPDEGLGLWAHVALRPGGVWSEAEEETIALSSRGRRTDIWEEANDETLILDRGQAVNLWRALGEEPPVLLAEGDDETFALERKGSGFWDELDEETLRVDYGQTQVWSLPNIRDLPHMKPMRAPGWALKKLQTSKGEEYHVLKNLRKGTYLKLDERQAYLWELMDGSQSVEDLAIAMFMKYQTFSLEWLAGFIGQLRARGFLMEESINVYAAMRQEMHTHTLNYWVMRLIRFFFRSELAIRSIDGFVSAVYRFGGRALFTWPVQIVVLLVALAGLPVFFYLTRQGQLTLLGEAGSAAAIGIVGLLVAELTSVFLHEMSHALTTKHYGRQVRRAGIGLYFGMLSFFVDTTDIWMEPRRSRLAVTWAGPYSGFFLGGLASLILLIVPATTFAGMAYQFAAFCYGIAFLNLNPLLKLDGYYLLMDGLEIPMLRERSTAFVRRKLWRKVRTREPFDREERIFAVFGVLALAWTAFAMYSMVRLYGGAIYGFLESLFGAYVALAIVAAVVGFFAIRFILRRVRARRMARA